MKIIFLDMDGVLITDQSLKRGRILWGRHHMPQLSCIVELNRMVKLTGAKIVVSSSWRIFPNINEILTAMGVKAEIIGKTQLPQFGVQRGTEVLNWLHSNVPSDNKRLSFVILDDWGPREFEGLEPWLVNTSFNGGLTRPLADKAIKLLKTPCTIPGGLVCV